MMTKHEVLTWLERRGTQKTRAGMTRYGIVAKRAFGVPMGTLQSLAKRLGTDQTWPQLCGTAGGTRHDCWPRSWATRSA